jgi:rsbT antagonist protein RsbS
MDNLSLPFVEMGNILMVPISDNMDDETVSALQERVLNLVSENEPYAVILGLATVEVIDSYLARMLSETVEMISLMGTRSILAGMRPSVAITTIDLGLQIKGAESALNVDRALKMLKKDENQSF